MEKPYLYNTERIVHVPGHVASLDEMNFDDTHAEELYVAAMQAYNTPLAGESKELLHRLGVSPVKHLPLYDGGKRFAQAYSVCVVPYPLSDEKAVAYPFGGKAITVEEGWTLGDQVYLAHDIKGVNVTKSSPIASSGVYNNQPFGVETLSDLSFDISKVLQLAQSGVLTCRFLPTLVYDEFQFKNRKFKPYEEFGALQRLWASNLRVNSIYESTALTPDPLLSWDIGSLTSSPDNTVDIISGRLYTFINDAAAVYKYNQLHGTNYKLGCAVHMGDKFTFASYALAFRKQMILNLAGMINNELWHGNFSGQNVSVACEVGDYDHEANSTPEKNIYHLFRDSYLIQALIANTIGNEPTFYSQQHMWSELAQKVPRIAGTSLVGFISADEELSAHALSTVTRIDGAYEMLQSACNNVLRRNNTNERISSLIEK